MIDAGLKAQSLTNHVGGRKRQNRRGKERRIEQAEGKQHASPFSGQGHQGPGRVRGVGDVALAGSVQRGRRADDDEEDDDHATDASEHHVGASLWVLPRPHPLLHKTSLEVKELPGGDRGAHQRRQHQQISGVKMETGDGHVLGRLQPVGLGQHGGKQVGQIEAARHQKYFLHLAIGTAQHQHPDENRG